MESIIAATITGVLAVLGSYVGNLAISAKKSREDAIKDAEREVRQTMRLDTIEKKVDIHNGYAEKFSDISKKFGNIGNDITAIKKDIEYLKRSEKV